MNKTQLLKVWFLAIFLSTNLFLVGQGTLDTTFNNLLRTENGGWVAGDAAYSIFLPDGRTLWLFGDSFIGTVLEDSSLAAGAHMIRNCAVIQEDTVMTALYNGTFEAPVDFVKTLNPDTTWYWPEHGIVENDTLKIIFSEFGPTDGTPGWNFEYRSAWVVLFSYPELELIQQIYLPYYEDNGVMYGDRIMTDGGYSYIYGRKEENPSNNIPHAHLARVASGNLLSDWEFYDGNNWVSDPIGSNKLTDQPVSQQFGVFPHQDKYVMITQEIWLGNKVYSMVANQPEGPWSNATMIYDIPLPFADMLTYNAYPHPQFDENNELLVSYNSNGDFWEIFNNVELYRPNFFRISYEEIHPSFTPTGIISPKGNNMDVILYPNPAQNNITFELTCEENDILEINIYNTIGVKVRRLNLPVIVGGNQKANVDISDLKRGLYLFEINGAKGKFIHN